MSSVNDIRLHWTTSRCSVDEIIRLDRLASEHFL